MSYYNLWSTRQPRPLLYIHEEGTFISTPAGNIGIRHSLKTIKSFINELMNFDEWQIRKHIARCPICEQLGLRVREGFFFGLGVVYAGTKRLVSERLDFSMLETFKCGWKKSAVICLECEYNRTPSTPILPCRVHRVDHSLGACNKCAFSCQSLHYKHTDEEFILDPRETLSDFHNFYFKCLNCGHQQDFDAAISITP